MRIVPLSNVDYLRSHPNDSSRFPSPFWATDRQLESVEYVAELWWDDDGVPYHISDDFRIVVTFDDIEQFYDTTPDGYDDWHGDVHAYLRDCIDNGFHPCLVHD